MISQLGLKWFVMSHWTRVLWNTVRLRDTGDAGRCGVKGRIKWYDAARSVSLTPTPSFGCIIRGHSHQSDKHSVTMATLKVWKWFLFCYSSVKLQPSPGLPNSKPFSIPNLRPANPQVEQTPEYEYNSLKQICFRRRILWILSKSNPSLQPP